MYFHDNRFDYNIQLDDGKNDWESKKIKTIKLSESFNRLKKIRKSSALSQCGTYLEFRNYIATDTFKLHRANFCRVRLCPLCSWRRSLKIFGQVSRIMDAIPKENQFLFLTLTCKNVTSDCLFDTLDKLFYAFKKFCLRFDIKNTFIGYFRALEVTYNKKTGTYHPHFHVILCANKSYFKKHYIKQDQFQAIWRSCLQIDYDPIVDVRKFTTKKGIAESAKYAVKDSDFFTKSGMAIDHVVNTLDDALANRRLVALGGIFKDIQKQLKFDDMENGDLIHTDGEDLREDIDYIVERYGWHVGHNAYYIFKD